ncbi:MAG: OmpA family protein [Bacteroidetes bacterium]|nr:OmpA family protein [Bacteroidota bacterium]
MKKVFFIHIFLFLLICTSSFAQLEKANKHYDNKEYLLAIKQYENILKNDESPEALEKIANSYRLIKNYQQAQLYYARLMNQKKVNPINHLYYGMVLKSNNRIDEAKAEFKLYAVAVPDDKIGKLLMKACDDIKLLTKKPKQFDVSPVANINTEQSEFSPVFFKNQLVFISDVNKNLLNEKQNFLHVYSYEIKKGSDGVVQFSAEPEAFPWPVNSDFHDGPVSFNEEQNMVFITHVDLFKNKDKKFVNRTKLYFSSLKENKWSKLKPFQFNSDEFSVAHASISADGQKLFFASDKPGGEGGMDIYVCEKEGKNWGQPQNLGNKINTIGEEVFPYIRKDGMLYFSSGSHAGFGGLDIFSATSVKGKYTNVKNLGALVNSAADDFGIVFSDDKTTGYFSSDRMGGKGSDDIYSFTALDKLLTISGKIVISQNLNNPLKNNDVMLLSEAGQVLNLSTTDSKGFFKFEDLDPEKKYMVKLDDSGPKFSNKAKYYLADEKEVFIRETGVDGKGGKFVFRNLPADPNTSSDIASDGVTFAGNLLVGKNSTKPLTNTKVNLLNEKGEVVQTVYTNSFGSFVFTNLPADQNFLVKVDENDTQLPANTKIIMTNKSGKEMQATSSGDNGSFKFTFLAADKTTLKLMAVEDTELRIDFKGKFVSDDKTPLANSIVNLVNEKGEILATTKTDAFGAFKFENLPADQNVLFQLDEADTQLKKLKKIFLTDSKDAIVKEISRSSGAFKFTILPSEKQKLGIVYVDDPWLKVLQLKTSTNKQDLKIIENIYYEYSKYEVTPEASKILYKVIDIMEKDPQLVIEISSHTDSRSSSETNMKRSEQRANAAVDYILKNGITKDRISGKGYGESKLINRCIDGVECTEEEHAKNRRTEFKVSRKEK